MAANHAGFLLTIFTWFWLNNVGDKDCRKGISNMYYLYKKTHKKTGMKYLGQTKNNPFTYKGSGLYWKRHLKKHGNDVNTEILKECKTKEDLKSWGEYYSDLWKVVDSDEWANMKPEIGDGGSVQGINLGRTHTDETKEKISKAKKGIAAPYNKKPKSAETKRKLRLANLGKTVLKETIEKMLETKSKNGTFQHTIEAREKMKKPKSFQHRENMIKAQHRRRELEEDKMWITDGKNNKIVSIQNDIPNGWYKGRTTDTIPPSQKGKYWINNGIINQMSYDIPPGWVKGRLNYKRRNK